MSSLAVTVLVQHLTDPDAIDLLGAEGFSQDLIADEELRPIFAFAERYFYESGCRRAPSMLLMQENFGDLLEDHEIDVEAEPEDTAEWAIRSLKGAKVYAHSATFAKAMSEAMSTAAVDDRVEVLQRYAAELTELAVSVDRRSVRVDARTATEEMLRSYHQRAESKGELRGLTIGVPEIDSYMGGLRESELGVLAGPPKSGKAQPLEAKVLTPSGWVCMGDLGVGDEVVGRNGRATEVVAVHPQGEVDIYRVSTFDGASVEVCGDHLWEIYPHALSPRVISTTSMRDALAAGRNRYAYIPTVGPVEFGVATDLPLDPYALGLLLGDGGMTKTTPTFTTADPELLGELERRLPDSMTYRLAPREDSVLMVHISHPGRGNPVVKSLADLGLLGHKSVDKFIPEKYLFSSVSHRMDLLRGLLDTDGGVEGATNVRSRHVKFYTSSVRLAEGLRHLVESLGGTAKWRVRDDVVGATRDSYTLAVRLPIELGCPFRLRRKAEVWGRSRPEGQKRGPTRRVVDVTFVGRKEAQCITVAAEDGLYVTERFLVTHNSWCAAWAALSEWRRGRATVLYTLENTVPMTLDRIACMATNVDAGLWDRGEASPEEIDEVETWLKELAASPVPLWVAQPELGQRSFPAMVQNTRLLDAKSMIVDQLTFVEIASESDRRPKTVQIGDALHTLKGMIGGRFPLSCLLMHQISREGAKSANKVGHLEMYHVADSAEIERSADFLLGLYRSPDEKVVGEAKLQLMAARRTDIRAWQMRFRPEVGVIDAMRPITL